MMNVDKVRPLMGDRAVEVLERRGLEGGRWHYFILRDIHAAAWG